MRRRGRPRHPDILTPREWEVLSLIEQGASNDEIARRLDITERTAKYHVSEILSKLGVSSRDQAVAAAGERSVRTGVLGHWALALKVAATVAAVAVVAGLAVVAWMVIERGGDEEDVPSLALEDVYARVLSGATRPDQILHTTLDYQTRTADGERQLLFGEVWIDPDADAVRSETHPGEDWPDTASDGEDLIISTGELEYHENRGGDAYRGVAQYTCPETTSAVIRALLLCGGDPRISENHPRVITDSEWDGEPAVAVITADGTIVDSNEIPAPPSGLPTFAPNPTAGQVTTTRPPTPEPTPVPSPAVYDFTATTYLDPATFLPFASKYDYDYEDDGMSYTYIIRYEHEFIDRSSVPADFFDPKSIGWRG